MSDVTDAFSQSNVVEMLHYCFEIQDGGCLIGLLLVFTQFLYIYLSVLSFTSLSPVNRPSRARMHL